MGDIEEQVGATLAAAAEQAPAGTGLAAGARQRHRVRRQRRIVVGGVAAAVVLAVSVGALAAGRGDNRSDIAEDPTVPPSGPPPGGWQTIRQGDVVASVPADWRRYDCDEGPAPIHAPVDPCDSWTGAAFYGSATYDAEMEAGVVIGTDGVQTGYVNAGTLVLAVADADGDLVRRALASARVEGQPEVDGSRWVTFDRFGMTYEVPAWWGRGEDGDRSGYSVCLTPVEGAGESSSEQLDATHYVMRQVPGPEGTVVVTAPTQAVAELVMATVEIGPDAAPAACVDEDFTTGLLPPEGGEGEPVEGGEEALDQITFAGIVLEVPPTWTVKDQCGASVVEFSPGGEPCTDLGEGVSFRTPVPDIRQGYEPGDVVAEEVDGVTLWTGYVLRGDYAVFITHPDQAIVELLLGKVRP